MDWRKRWTRATGLAVVGATALAASAQASDRADLSVALGTRTPGSPTSLDLHVLYKRQDDSNAKPPQLTRAAFMLPAGTRFDTRAAPVCHATDAELQARGRAACPADSAIGSGSLTAITGFGPPADPFAADTTVFDGGSELIELVSVKGSDATAGLDRLTIEGNTLRANPPATPGGPPDGQTTIREIRLSVPVRGRLVSAPPSCPATGVWTSRGDFAFADGGTTAVTATTPCVPTASARPSTRLRVSPRRARVGRRIRLRVRARSSVPRCARGATIRVGSRRGHTDSDGRATLRFPFGASGRRRVALFKRGCPRAHAFVKVVRR